MTRKLLVGSVSESLDKLRISYSHSSSYQWGDSSRRDISISWISLGVAIAISPGVTLLIQNADMDSCSLWITRIGSGLEWSVAVSPSKRRFLLIVKHRILKSLNYLLSNNDKSSVVCGSDDVFEFKSDGSWRFLPNTARMNMSWTCSCRTR